MDSTLGATIIVPDEYSTIQAGIDSAAPGDTVIVRDGIYTAEGNMDLNLKGKPITVKSEHGPAKCIIDGMGASNGFLFHSSEGAASVISGFTIRNFRTTFGGVINCFGASPTIANCTISRNFSRYGSAIYCSYSSPIIANCTIAGNFSSFGGSIDCHYSSPMIMNSILWNNAPAEISVLGATMPRVMHSNIKEGYPGVGNIALDPCFIDAHGGNYRLKPNSICIHMGSKLYSEVMYGYL